jgi:hypothetical protein
MFTGVSIVELLILAVVVKTSFGKEVFNGTSALDKV